MVEGNMRTEITSKQIKNLQAKVHKAHKGSRGYAQAATNALSRLGISTSGGSAVGSREYDNVLGYELSDQNYETYKDMYDRGDIAKRIVDAPVSAVWSNKPAIQELANVTDFLSVSKMNAQWNKIYKELKLGDAFRRADKMARLGSFSVIFLGYEGATSLSRPPRAGSSIKYVQPYSKANVVKYDLVDDIASPRNGLPEYYYINNSVDSGSTAQGRVDTETVLSDDGKRSEGVKVHYSRIIHITDDNLDSNTEAVPIFTHVYNRLIDLIKIVGGAGEMFWLGARPGYAAIVDPDTTVTEENYEEMEKVLEAYDNDLTRWIQAKGMKIESLSPQVYSPKEHFDVAMACISAASGIPQRVLTGAEAGELASTQDKANWETTVTERRSIFAEPKILHPLVDALQKAGQLDKGDYNVVWPDLTTMTEADKADAAYKYAQAFMFATTDVAKLELIGPRIFCQNIMNWDEPTTKAVVENWPDAIVKLKEELKEQEAVKTAKVPTEDPVKEDADTKKKNRFFGKK